MNPGAAAAMTPPNAQTEDRAVRKDEHAGWVGGSGWCHTWRCIGLAVAVMGLVSAGAVRAASPPATASEPSTQRFFATPEDALRALGEAVKVADQAELTAIFGPDRERLLSGDPVEDRKALEQFGASLDKAARLEKVGDSKFTVLVG